MYVAQSMAFVILGALFPTQFVRMDFLRPSSAIAPVLSGRTFRCALRVGRVDRAGAVCYSCGPFTLGKRKGVGGPPSASWEDNSRQSQEVYALLAGMTRREVNRLAQGAPLTL